MFWYEAYFVLLLTNIILDSSIFTTFAHINRCNRKSSPVRKSWSLDFIERSIVPSWILINRRMNSRYSIHRLLFGHAVEKFLTVSIHDPIGMPRSYGAKFVVMENGVGRVKYSCSRLFPIPKSRAEADWYMWLEKDWYEILFHFFEQRNATDLFYSSTSEHELLFWAGILKLI